MIKTVSDCVDCGLPCTPSCEYYDSYSTITTCDCCGSDDELYLVEGKQLCFDCATEALKDEIIESLWSEIKAYFIDEISDILEGCKVADND